MELHLDLVGGLAGDVFIAALLDLFPEHEAGLRDSLARTGGLLAGVTARLAPHNDGMLAGRRFLVERLGGNGGGHDHVAWRRIREALVASELDPAVRGHAIGIFRLLAEAEARVHGMPVDDVRFHEVGAWDSIADIVAAAWLIAALDARRWTRRRRAARRRAGADRARPAAGAGARDGAAARGFRHDRRRHRRRARHARPGPRSCAISARDTARPAQPRESCGAPAWLRHAACCRASATACACSPSTRTKQAPGFDADRGAGDRVRDRRPVAARTWRMALDRLRAPPGVLDVVQTPVFGKKGRMMVHLQLLARPEALRMCSTPASTRRRRSACALRRRRAALPRSAWSRSRSGGRRAGRSVSTGPAARPPRPRPTTSADLHGHAAREASRGAGARSWTVDRA